EIEENPYDFKHLASEPLRFVDEQHDITVLGVNAYEVRPKLSLLIEHASALWKSELQAKRLHKREVGREVGARDVDRLDVIAFGVLVVEKSNNGALPEAYIAENTSEALTIVDGVATLMQGRLEIRRQV